MKFLFSAVKVVVPLLLLFALGFLLYRVSYVSGYNTAVAKYQEELDNTIALFQKNAVSLKRASSSPSPTSVPQTISASAKPISAVTWGGPALWEAVNKRRVQLGVNPLSQRDELCTLASIRLNQLLELGKLDGHEGFSKMPTDRPDLKWIYDKYNLSEFLVSGATSPTDAVSLWENTLGHKKLLTGGEYVWGCIYAQNTFAVAITAY